MQQKSFFTEFMKYIGSLSLFAADLFTLNIELWQPIGVTTYFVYVLMCIIIFTWDRIYNSSSIVLNHRSILIHCVPNYGFHRVALYRFGRFFAVPFSSFFSVVIPDHFNEISAAASAFFKKIPRICSNFLLRNVKLLNTGIKLRAIL